ncbi:MAG: tetratricopeptide repeat protein, partial [Candidatus Acidoferrales bacterium]
LIASFDNRTGEPLFDGTLEYALERELSNSRYVNVVPRPRIDDALQLMRRSLDTALTPTVAREVALRDGGIRAVLTGRVEKLDSTYVLSVALMNPSEGITVASFSEDAQGQQNVVLAVRRLSNRLRETLGEKLALIRENEQKLEKVTTPSLRALQLYSQAVALLDPVVTKSKSGMAAELLQQAVAADPDFASARIWLAHCIQNIGKKNEAAPHYQRAFELADTTTDRERYFILGSYYWRYLEDNDKAAQAFEVLVQLYPDHFWGTQKLATIYGQQGRWEEAVPYRVRLADFRPNDFGANFRAAFGLAGAADNPVAAQAYVERARALASPEIIKRFPAEAAWMESFPAREHWLRGDVAQAMSEVTRVAQTMKSRTPRERQWFGSMVGTLYLRLGKLKAAEEAFQNVRPSDLNFYLAWVAFARGDGRAFREKLVTARIGRDGVPVPNFTLASFLVRAGLLVEAENMLLRLEKKFMSPARSTDRKYHLPVVRGELALTQGRTAEAFWLLQDALEGQRRRGGFASTIFFLGSESLAHAWEQQGNFSKALKVLEEASQEKTSAAMFWGSSGYCWLRVQAQLAQVYRKLGREQEAQEIEAELLKLLAYADPDHHILRQLRATQALAAAQSPN